MVIQGLRKKDDLPAVENLLITDGGYDTVKKFLRVQSASHCINNMIYPSAVPFYGLLSDLIYRIEDDLQRNMIAHAGTVDAP